MRFDDRYEGIMNFDMRTILWVDFAFLVRDVLDMVQAQLQHDHIEVECGNPRRFVELSQRVGSGMHLQPEI